MYPKGEEKERPCKRHQNTKYKFKVFEQSGESKIPKKIYTYSPISFKIPGNFPIFLTRTFKTNYPVVNNTELFTENKTKEKMTNFL